MSELQQALRVERDDLEKERRAIDDLRRSIEIERQDLENRRRLLDQERRVIEAGRTARQMARTVREEQIRRLAAGLASIHRSRLWRLGHTYWELLRALARIRRALFGEPRTRGREADGGGERPTAEERKTTFDRPVESRPKQRLYRAPASPTVPPPSGSSYDVLCFPIIDWEFRFQRPQQLMTQFARRGHRVFYFRTTFHQEGSTALVKRIRENVFGLQLPGPPALNLYHGAMAELVAENMAQALEDLRRDYGIEQAVCLVQLPFWTPLAFGLRRRWGWRVVYDCMDEHSGFSTNDAAMLEAEHGLIRGSELVVTTSRALYEKISPLARRTISNPNAADFEHFSRPRNGQLLADLPGPIIGYFGAISEWFDVEMVRHAAAARPKWQFVLIGDTYGARVESLEALDNVHLLGERLYDELPGYLHSFDVATIPFKITPLTRATNPVKFYEYLSAGTPIVASALPELEPFENYYYPVATRSEFLPQLEAALAEENGRRSSARIDFARRNTWSARFEKLRISIREAFAKVAIVIVSYNNLEYLRLCLESLEKKTIYPNFEVIVVDNASGSEVADFLREEERRKPWLKVIVNHRNVGFPLANNIGIRAAGNCEYIVLLNDDVVVTRGWLSRLLRCLDEKCVELVGPVTNWAGNEARIEVDYTTLEEMDAFAENYTQRHENRSFDIKVLALYCVAMRRSLLNRIGMLDERFGTGMFEDDDLAERIRRMGGRLLCTESVFVHHWGRSSFGTLDQEVYDRLFEENRRKFEEKWGEPWVAHRHRESFAERSDRS